MLDIPVASYSTYLLDSVAPNSSDMLPRQKLSWKVDNSIIGFKLKDLFSIDKQITIIAIVM